MPTFIISYPIGRWTVTPWRIYYNDTSNDVYKPETSPGVLCFISQLPARAIFLSLPRFRFQRTRLGSPSSEFVTTWRRLFNQRPTQTLGNMEPERDVLSIAYFSRAKALTEMVYIFFNRPRFSMKIFLSNHKLFSLSLNNFYYLNQNEI